MVALLMMLLVGKLGLLGWDVDGEVLSLNPLVCVFAFFTSLNLLQKIKGAVLSKQQRASVGSISLWVLVNLCSGLVWSRQHKL